MAKDIRIFHLRPFLDELYEKRMNLYTAFQKKAQNLILIASLIDLILTFIRHTIIYLYLIYLVINQGMSVSQFLLYFNVVNCFSTWIIGIFKGFNTLYNQSLDISIVRECLEYPEPFKFKDGIMLKIEPNYQYEIKLENVSYRYPKQNKDTLTNINLTLHPGEKLAIVGLNGAGKTTLIKLICGFLNPTKGKVLLNGKDIKIYNRQDYYKMFSALFQEFSLLAGTIETNITQDDIHKDTKKMMESIKKADLDKKIESLKEKEKTYLNKDVFEDAIALSGGETQRLMLARALYKDAPFIILDEPTAALDPIAEADIYSHLDEIVGDKTAIYISHRLSSCLFCDEILVFHEGQVIQQGNHETLLADKSGKYYELWNAQAQYYKK